MALDASQIEAFMRGDLDTDTLTGEELDQLLALDLSPLSEDPKQEEIPAEDPKQEEIPAEDPKQEEIPAEDPKQEEIPAEDPKQEEIPAEAPKRKPKTIDEFKEDRFRLNSELNTYRQKLEAAERKLAEQSQQPISEENIWDTEFQRKQAREIEEAKRIATEAQAELNALRRERELEKVYKESQAVADEFGIQVNVREANELYGKLVEAKGRRITLDEFAEEVGSEEAKGFFALMDADRHRRENNFGKLRTAFRDLELDEVFTPRQKAKDNGVSEAQKAEAQASREAIAKAKQAAPTMPASYSGKDTTMTMEWAFNWLEKNGGNEYRWSEEDRKTFRKIQEKYL